MADENPRDTVTCKCGKTIQKRSYSQHCSSKRHLSFLAGGRPPADEPSPSIDSLFDLTSYLRRTDLRNNRRRTQTLVQRYHNTDPYTKACLELENSSRIAGNFDIDHIHEAQCFACAIRRTPEFLPCTSHVLALRPLRRVLNDVENLTITDASLNRSKGQAMKYFLGQYETSNAISLLAAFIQTASGKERSIAHFATNIIDLISATSADMSQSIREIRRDDGHVAGAHRYEMVADQFDTIIDRMQLTWTENIKLRNGKVFQPYH